ncbi:hypothetical protein, partial [Flavobacterium branchiophilum]
MKIRYKIMVLGLFFASMQATAQYGGGYGGGNQGYGGGMNRMGSGGMQQGRTPEKPKEIPAEETAAQIIEKLKPELNLDELQSIAIANILTSSIKAQGVILKKEASDEDKTNDIKALSDTTDRKIMEMLNKEQKEKYTLLKDNPEKLNPTCRK